MGTIDSMLIACRNLLGTSEHPPGSNHNNITVWYGFDSAWCDMAVSYAAALSDNAAAVGRFAWTPSHAYWFKGQGRWHYGLGGVRAGDIVFFDWSGSRSIDAIDHVGVVEAVRSDGTIITLEGNTDDQYLRRVRNSATVVGYGRPNYSGSAPMPTDDGILRSGSAGQLVRDLQTHLNTVLGVHLAVDGSFGVATQTALRTFQLQYKLKVDGEYGPASAAMMKAALAGGNQPVRPVPAGYKPPAPLVIDGELGPATTSALQRWLNGRGAQLGVDGFLGPATKKALQRQLGVGQDGITGPVTVKALQRFVGAAVDGVWGPATTRRLQQKLVASGA